MKKILLYFNILMIILIILGIVLIVEQNQKEKTSTLMATPTPARAIPPKETDPINMTKDLPPSQRKTSVLLTAPLVKQLPELLNGCEITSLTMLLQYYGIKKDKMDLVPELIRDDTPIIKSKNGQILTWGDPNIGFVGDITGKKIGYGIYHEPLYQLLKTYIDTAVDLSGTSLSELEQKLSAGYPVVVWTTVNYSAPAENDWKSWSSPTGTIKATFKEHSVLLVGYDKDHVYLNDPLSGKKQVKVNKHIFLLGWTAMGKQAISYGN
ncbi:C39 family peptidase [Paenibacillus sp. MMO-58]|uniref:C39 family peptidase n=1 Tax=Paenibacillus sp. MMO-58 TaxID=3081290 RepID=UPI00301A92F9